MLLPLNEETDIISYAHHTYVNAIMDQKNQGLYMDLMVKNGSKRSWNKYEEETKFVWNDDELRVEGSPYAAHTHSILWTECGEHDELEIEIKYFHYSNTESIINLFVSGEDVESSINNCKKIYRLGKGRRYGLAVKIEDNLMPQTYSGEFTRMKLVRDGNIITSYIYIDDDWFEADTKVFSQEIFNNKPQIGIEIDMGEDQYYSWLFMNYLQLYYNRTDYFIRLDYYMFPRKNYNFLHSMTFIETYLFTEDDIYGLFGGVNKCIHWNLAKNRYVQIDIDEYYVSGSPVYQKEHKNHVNLIYGYDEDKHEYISLGFNTKPVVHHIPEDIVEDTLFLYFGIRTYQYYTNVNPIKFNLQNFMITLGDFVHSYPSSYRLCNLMGITDDIFGLDVFKELFESEDGQHYLNTDIRVIYLLYEYNYIMQKRLEFLEYRGYLKSNVEALKQQCHEMLKFNTVINNAFMISQHKGEATKNKLSNHIKKLYEMERDFSNLLYETLMNDNKEILMRE